MPPPLSETRAKLSASPPPPAPRRGGGAGWAIVIAAAVLAVAGGTWWWTHRAAPEAAGAGAPAAVPRGAGERADSGAGVSAGRGFGGGAGRVQPVSVAAVQQRDIALAVNAMGSVVAANTAVVRSKVAGELKAIYFTEGQTVRAGQVLAQIDPQAFEIALAQAQAQLARDQAQWRNAQVDQARYRDLVAKDAAPRQQMETQNALVQQLQATLKADQAAVDNARLLLGYTRVVAPISGLSGLKQADLGNVVSPSDANGLVSIAQMQPAAVVFALPELQLPRVREQLRAGRALPVQAWDRDQKTLLAEGKVASTDNAIDPATGTLKVKALFANADARLFPNQTVNVRLQLDTQSGVLAVPTAALQRGAQGSFVYVVGADATVALRRVSVGASDAGWAAVQGELQPGQQVVIDGADRLRDGAKVEVIVPARASAGDGRGARRGAAAASGASAAASSAAGAQAAPAAATAAASGAAAGLKPMSAPASASASVSTLALPPEPPAPPVSGARPRWMDRVPPEMVDRIKAMSDDERRAFFQQRRAQRGESN